MRVAANLWIAVCCCVLWSSWLNVASAADTAMIAEGVPAELKIANRSIVVLRATLLSETPEQRVSRARAIIDEALDSNEALEVRVESVLNSYIVLLGQRRAFIISPGDIDTTDSSTRNTAEIAAEKLRLVVAETQQTRNVNFMLMAAGFSLVATLIYFILLRGVSWVRRKLVSQLPRLMQRHISTLKVGHTPLIDIKNIYYVVDRLLWLLYWALVFLFSYQWLGFVLSRFPYTRPWGESLNIYLLNMAGYLLEGVISALPGLAVAVAIFFMARGIIGFTRSLLMRMARPGTITWLSGETLQPTMRLTSIAIWLFALAMAYPYLPGAGTDAFKGLSVLVGLMISLGASSVVGQAAAGLILTYSRTLRPGEFVNVGGHEGTVTELGMFTTTIRTGLGEVLTIPNAMITGGVTKNYSRTVNGSGYVVDTVVTIGYDTPWRQVEAMLLEAAKRTDGIINEPAPQVFQTALSDFYPEYRLVAQAIPSEPRPRAQLLSVLHANIQDVFNEYGVAIMSPHYLSDPQDAKLVPRENWYAAPAQKPKTALGEGRGSDSAEPA
ncbi:mechanosensitive ion channel family protein [Pseudomonas sp. M30-35]|uniref:mechanosensitive ion channel family protein n=1 Tax=Pseudomonas sp. M30-35 TaxID=1981174 RepID=UPI000B3C9041|nr:mechanosensitive ion channel protein MscS [Pseudomonas sp. M30-35]